MDTHIPLNPIIAYLPLILVGLLFAFAFLPLAKRKGVNRLLVFIFMPIPFINIICLSWLTSKADVELEIVKDKVAMLEKILREKGLI